MSGVDGSTDWNAYDVEAMWAMVAGEGSCESWEIPLAWRSMANTLDAHRRNLKRSLEVLAQAWPPEHNPGAAKMVEVIERMIGSLDDSASRSVEISIATAAVMDELTLAQQELRPLLEQYRQKSRDWTPASWDHAEDEINRRARAIMARAEAVIEERATSFAAPKEYIGPEVDGAITLRDPDDSGDDSRGWVGPAISGIPPREVFTAPHHPPPPMPRLDPVASGVSLAGHAPAAPAVPGGSSIGAGPSPSAVPAAAPAVGTGALPYANGVIGAPAGGGVYGAPAAGGGAPRTSPSGAGPGRMVMPFGGVIGAGPGGIVMPGGGPSGSGGAPGARLTPGGGGMPGVLGAGGTSGTGGAVVSQGRGGRSERPGEPPVRDPDNPWAVAQGVPPVIRADRTPVRHDPGPGVIGIDR